jgi:hypothetical protein
MTMSEQATPAPKFISIPAASGKIRSTNAVALFALDDHGQLWQMLDEVRFDGYTEKAVFVPIPYTCEVGTI